MSKITTIEEFQETYKSSGVKRINNNLGTRYEDIEKHRDIIESVLGCEYNLNVGFSTQELIEILSVIIEDNDMTESKLPLFTESVLPYLSNVFNLKISKGLTYYFKLLKGTPFLESLLLQAEDFFTVIEESETDHHNYLNRLYDREMANELIKDIKAQIPEKSKLNYDITSFADFRVGFDTMLRSLSNSISRESGLTGLTDPTTIIVNIELLPSIESLPEFKKALKDNSNSEGIVYLAGVYKNTAVLATFDHVIQSNEVIGLYKSNKQVNLAPAVSGLFMPAIIRDTYLNDKIEVGSGPDYKKLITSGGIKVAMPCLTAIATLKLDIPTLV